MSNIQQSINQAISLGSVLLSQTGLPAELATSRKFKAKGANLQEQLTHAGSAEEISRIRSEMADLAQEEYERSPSSKTSKQLEEAKQEAASAAEEAKRSAMGQGLNKGVVPGASEASAISVKKGEEEQNPIAAMHHQVAADYVAGSAAQDALNAVRLRMQMSRKLGRAVEGPIGAPARSGEDEL